MNRVELAKAVRVELGVTHAQAKAMVKAVEGAMTDALVKGDKVSLAGFVTISVKDQDACERRNPKTKETVQVPAKKKVSAKVGSGLKKKVNA